MADRNGVGTQLAADSSLIRIRDRRLESRPLVYASLAIAGAVVLFAVDPATSHLYPACPFHWLTGLDCPFCGSTRAVHALLHLHPFEALRSNALTTIGGVYLAGRWLLTTWTTHGRPMPAPAAAIARRLPYRSVVGPGRGRMLAIVVTVLFTVIRNVPLTFFSFLRP